MPEDKWGQIAELDGIPEAGTCADPEATLEGEDCGIETTCTLAAGSKEGADPKATAWRQQEATLVGPVCVADTELAAETLGIVTVMLHCWKWAGYHALWTGGHIAWTCVQLLT